MLDHASVVTASGVHKQFHLPASKSDSIKHSVIQSFHKKNRESEIFRALKGVSFEVKKGEFFGVLGRNGSGKSTLLKILAGIYQADQGSVSVEGRLVPFIELGVGFRPDLSGRENVYLNGALLGFSKQQMDARYDEIVAFAELEDFMGQKLKNYSSGMKVRLAFAVATHADADILLLDEVLAVGDASFQKKCYNHFRELKKNKKTVIFVTHSMGLAKEYCDRGVLIEGGEITEQGEIEKVADAYTQLFNTAPAAKSIPSKKKKPKKRWGDKSVKIVSHSLKKTNELITFKVRLESKKLTDDYVKFGFQIKDAAGKLLMGANNLNVPGGKSLDFSSSRTIELEYEVTNILGNGTYTLSATVNKDGGTTVCDQWNAIEIVDNTRDSVHYPLVAPGKVTITSSQKGSAR